MSYHKKIRQRLWLSTALMLPLVSFAQGDTVDADRALGEKYVYCGQLINAVNRAGGGTDTSGQTAMLMSLLGSQLLGADTPEQFKPYRDAARKRIEEESREPKAQQGLFDRYLECTQLHARESAALLERFKARLASNLKQQGQQAEPQPPAAIP